MFSTACFHKMLILGITENFDGVCTDGISVILQYISFSFGIWKEHKLGLCLCGLILDSPKKNLENDLLGISILNCCWTCGRLRQFNWSTCILFECIHFKFHAYFNLCFSQSLTYIHILFSFAGLIKSSDPKMSFPLWTFFFLCLVLVSESLLS